MTSSLGILYLDDLVLDDLDLVPGGIFEEDVDRHTSPTIADSDWTVRVDDDAAAAPPVSVSGFEGITAGVGDVLPVGDAMFASERDGVSVEPEEVGDAMTSLESGNSSYSDTGPWWRHSVNACTVLRPFLACSE